METTPTSGPQPPTNDEKNLAMLANLLGITFFAGPLVMWLIFREKGGFVEQHAKEVLNFGITWTIPLIISSITCCFNFFLSWIVVLIVAVFCIIGAIKASKGEFYKYPMCLRLVN